MLEAGCYDQAILEARITLEYSESIDDDKKQKLYFIIVRSMIGKGKYLDAYEILKENCEYLV